MLRLYGCRENAAQIWELDSADRATDEGAPIVPFVLGAPFDTGGAQGVSEVRRLVQWVTLRGDVTLTVVPVTDEVERRQQARTVTLRVADGERQRVEVPVAARGRSWGVRVEGVSGGPFALGACDVVTVDRGTGDRI